MEKYVFLITLLFNLSIVGTLLLLQITHRAARHPMIWIEVVTLVLLIYEVGREMFTLSHGAQMVSGLRVPMYAIEHILLGLVLREAWLFYEKAYQRKTRKRSRVIS